MAVDVFLLAGQSNIAGSGLSSADLPPHLQASDSGIKIWGGASFATLVLGTNANLGADARWGPIGEFACQYRRVNPASTVYFVEDGVSNTDLATDWNPATSSAYFDQMKTAVASAITALSGQSPSIKALLWGQGETDALDVTKAANYQANLTAFFAAARAQWGDASMKIIVSRLSNSANWTYRSTVRSGQAAAVAADGSLTTLIDADSWPIQGDGAHYTAYGQVLQGRAMWTAYSGLKSTSKLTVRWGS